MAGRLFARKAGSALFLLPKEASNGRLDALLLGCLVEGVLAAVAAAGVAPLTILQVGQTVRDIKKNLSEEMKGNQRREKTILSRNVQISPSNVSDVLMACGMPCFPV